MVNLAMVVTGLYAFLQLGVDAMPNINVAVVSVNTVLEGASPAQVEVALSKPIEDAVASLSGLDEVQSTSSVGRSNVSITFLTGKDPNVALEEVRSKVDALVNTFPKGTLQPVYGKFSSSDQPALQLAVTGQRSLRDLTEIVKYQIRDPLQTIPGVGQIQIFGGEERTIQIELAMDKLVQYGLSVPRVRDAVVTQNAKVPGGYLTSPYSEYLVSQPGQILKVADFNQVVLDRANSQDSAVTSDVMAYQEESILLGQVANVIDGSAERRSLARLNGQTTLSLSLTKTSDGNLIKIVQGVKDKLAAMKSRLPQDVRVEVVQDNAAFIQQSVDQLMEHLYLGSLLASLTVLLFMGSFRLTIIAMISIPVSLITTFALMWSMGYTLNFMTLLALTLAVGIVVDDAVVVLENIYRLIEEEGLSPLEASIQGMKGIAFAVLATTLSLIVLFLPLGFMPGTTGEYFRSWGITMAFSIAVSMLVSFTLTPVMCAKMLAPPKSKQQLSWLTRTLQDLYEKILVFCLKVRWVVLILVALTCLWGVRLFQEVGKEFIAADDQGSFHVDLTFPKSWPLERIDRELRPMEADLRSLPAVTQVMVTINDSDIAAAHIYVGLEPWAKRKPLTVFQVMDEARQKLSRHRLVKPSVTRQGDAQFSFILVGDDLGTLEKLSEKVMARLRKVPGILDLDSSLVLAVPEVRVVVDPVRCASLDVSPSEVSDTISMLIGGQKISSFEEKGHSYDVRMRLNPRERRSPQDVLQLYVPNSKSGSVELETVADIEQTLSPSTIKRYQRQRMVEIKANLSDKLPLQTALDKANAILKELHPPPGYGPQEHGDSKLMAQAATGALQAFLLAVLFMYMVLASQFENFYDPLIILATIPLSLPFALLSLQLSGMTLNLFSVLGLFLLFGVVKKNAILQIDRTNQLIAEGMPVERAILLANRDRLRPILMTTITLVVAMLPVALSGPTGAEKAPMAMVIVGGQTLCLLLTLIVVPVFTSYVESARTGLRSLRNWRNRVSAEP